MRGITLMVVTMSMMAVACSTDATVESLPVAQAAEPTAEQAAEPTAEPVAEPTPEPAAEPAEEAGPVCGIHVKDEDRYLDEFELVDCSRPHDSELAGEFVDVGGNDSVRTPESDVARAEGCGEVVAALTGRPVNSMGIEVGIDENRTDGSDVIYDCWMYLTSPGLLRGSLTEMSLQAALPEGVTFLSELAPGDCFDLAADEGFDLVVPGDCGGEIESLLAGTIQVDGDSAAYDADALVDEAFDACGAAHDDDYNAITYPDERGWTVGQRTVFCSFDFAWAAENGSDESAAEPEIVELCYYIDEELAFDEVDCDEPHNIEYAGTIEVPFETWPADDTETTYAMARACIATAEAHYGRTVIPGLSLEGLSTVDVDYGEPVEPDAAIDCFIRMYDGLGSLVGYVPDVGIEAALGEATLLTLLEPGTCFEFTPPDRYSLVYVLDCDAEGALLYLGQYESADRPYPGLDELRIERGEQCSKLVDEGGFIVDESTLTGNVPNEFRWNVGLLTASCEADPA